METLAVQSSLIDQGFDMMLYGMGSVFTFLIALVVAISLMSRLLALISPEPLAEAGSGNQLGHQAGNQAGHGVDPLTAKIIQAAIKQHRGS